ncbi:hypothetical protein [Prevotella corporis]|nr:hypothetical protein [Prevotella corporis]
MYSFLAAQMGTSPTLPVLCGKQVPIPKSHYTHIYISVTQPS